MKDIYIVVPTLDPDEKIMEPFIKELKSEFENILIVNDGSNKKHDKFFKKFEDDGIEVFRHHKNFGKGRALKNAFNYLLSKYPNIKGVVTCDSDGQHSVKDIKNCALKLLEEPDNLILGVRDFDSKNVPARSEFGNKITRGIFKNFIGIEITDTQTGLRGISKKLMEEFSSLAGERYEYETNMLIACKTKKIHITEVKIDTIYINSNEGSHFNPIKDSFKIYRLFFKNIFMSFSSFLLDIIIFAYLLGVLKINSKILAATIIARVISSIYNFVINKNIKFKNLNVKTLTKYGMLTAVQMFMSGCFVAFLANIININVIVLKIIVDTILWAFNLYVGSYYIFKGDIYE